MSDSVNVHEAKTHFSKLLQRVEAGETVTLARAGQPVAQLGPIAVAGRSRELGRHRRDLVLPNALPRALERAQGLGTGPRSGPRSSGGPGEGTHRSEGRRP